MSPNLDRFLALHAALKAQSPKPDSNTRPFIATALLDAEGSDADLIAATVNNHEALKSALGWSQAPTGSMRWVYAAMFAANASTPDRFLTLRDALRDAVKASRTGSLHAGGSRAALVLSLDPKGGRSSVPAFFEMKRALRPPWWRSNVSITDTFAAAHALTGESPQIVRAARDRAVEVFRADRRARGHKFDGARLTVLRGDSPERVLARFNAIEDARRADRYLRGRTDRGLAMEWAASGRTASDLPAIAAVMQDLPRSITSMGYAPARLAQMIAFPGTQGDPVDSATAMAAVVAAQAAMMAAIVAASTAAVTSASSASS